MTISPHNGRLQVEALVANLDIGFVKLGQEASVKVDAFPFTRFGVLHGKVVAIAPEAVDEQAAKRALANVTAGANAANAPPSGAPGQPDVFVFPVTIALDETTITVGDAQIPIAPGMTTTVEIKTQKRRVIDYLLVASGEDFFGSLPRTMTAARRVRRRFDFNPPFRRDRRPIARSGPDSRHSRRSSRGTMSRRRIFMLTITPGASLATGAASLSGSARKGKGGTSFFHGATSAVRLPDNSEWKTQPSAPSESRMRRQVSNSAVISTGRPARW